jgi:RimK-like ATP-grasp domain
MALLLLTLDRHKNGIWVTRLVEELRQINDGIQVQIAAIETFVHEAVMVGKDVTWLVGYRGIINRVSDAADPINVKKCLAILNVARFMNIPIFNGPDAYSLCCNKWCHHVLLARAGLQSPSTAVLDTSTHAKSSESLLESSQRLLPNARLPLLLKPNSGGFGDGIVRIDHGDQHLTVPPTNDGTILLQEYVSPAHNAIYRVWFLLGKVQCAIRRTISSDTNEFTSGCAAGGTGVCRRNAPVAVTKQEAASSMEAWNVPEEIRLEIEEQLLPSLGAIDAHAGSVEFLVHESTGQRLYFDLNLLSTLPIVVSNGREVWGETYNPWSELATAVLQVTNP